MTIFLITFLIMAVVIVIMSVGVLFGRKPVQGSCGGMNNIVGLKECEICGGEPEFCQNEFPDRAEEQVEPNRSMLRT
ncbi:MAG: (Na+)-NQR maturation NqrM [Proteobacteria bacterium]|jgi:uncharacterized protein|nr:(Na+)-NQR maturation NqrM [Pseudomonadota bacterium]MDA1291964.1 (Na+)-NQR maturation NqrM [Pseudomonadota bacterium]